MPELLGWIASVGLVVGLVVVAIKIIADRTREARKKEAEIPKENQRKQAVQARVRRDTEQNQRLEEQACADQGKQAVKARVRRDTGQNQPLAEDAGAEGKETIEKTRNLFWANQDLIEKFLEIAERKVSIVDEYGDENWEALPKEILVCLRKIAARENLAVNWKVYPLDRAQELGEYICQEEPPVWLELELFLLSRNQIPEEIFCMHHALQGTFKLHHSANQHNSAAAQELNNISGVDFETYVAKRLKELGFTDVRGTPVTGDQGADLIAKRNGKTLVIQIKRYSGPVGNGAIQEVNAAVSYYRGDEGWVITNSTFTPAARALAQKTNVRLIDGQKLAALGESIQNL